jgi:hypothetical protein
LRFKVNRTLGRMQDELRSPLIAISSDQYLKYPHDIEHVRAYDPKKSGRIDLTGNKHFMLMFSIIPTFVKDLRPYKRGEMKTQRILNICIKINLR